MLAGTSRFRASVNDYDWLGSGVYFWEYGVDRAYAFAQQQRERGKLKKPAVVGAVLQLGNCFDLMDTRFTKDLANGYSLWANGMLKTKAEFPKNKGNTADLLLRHLDCAVINWYLAQADEVPGGKYSTVRCGFSEGEPVFPGAGIQRQTHIQIAVRDPACIVGVFKPMMGTP